MCFLKHFELVGGVSWASGGIEKKHDAQRCIRKTIITIILSINTKNKTTTTIIIKTLEET